MISAAFVRCVRSLRLPLACVAFAAACGIFAPADVLAQVTWTGATNSNWGGANWSNGSLSNSFSSAVVFAGSTNASTNNDLTGGTVTTLTFNSNATAFTLAGNSITLSGSIVNNSSATQTISLPLSLTAGRHALNSTVAGGSIVVSGNITGGTAAGGVSVYVNNASGTVALTGSNSYTGNTSLNAGTLLVGSSNALGSGTLRFDGNDNSFRAYNANATVSNPVLVGTGTAYFDGSYNIDVTGNLIQNASRDFVNQLASGKSVTIYGSTSLQDPANSGSRQLSVKGSGTTEFKGPISNGGTTPLTSSGTMRVGGAYGGNFGTAISGTGGILVLSGTNTHSGGVALDDGGRLYINNAQALGSGSIAFAGKGAFDNSTGSPITVNNSIRMVISSGTYLGTNNSTFVTTGTFYISGGAKSFAVASGTVEIGQVGSDGADTRLTKDGSGTMIINNAAVTMTGTIRLGGGTLVVGNASALGSGIFDYSSATANLQAKSSDLTIANPFSMTSSTATFSGSQSLTFTGSLAMQNEDVVGSLGREVRNNIAAGKMLTFNGTTSLGQTGTARTLTITGSGNTVFGGQIIDGVGGTPSALGFRQNSTGTTTLSVANTYSGTTTVLQGTLVIGNASSLGASSARLAVDGGVLDLGGFSVTRTGSVAITSGTIQNGTLSNSTKAFDVQGGTVSAVLAGSAGLTKTSSGTATLSGSNTYSGTTNIAAGSLIAGGAAAFGSSALNVNGGVLDLGGQSVANAIAFYSGSVTNAAAYAGTQTVNALTSFSGTVGGTLNVASGGTLKGNAVTFTGPVSIGDGATHAPGNSPGAQTFTNGLSYSGSSTLQWELAANTDSAVDAGTLYDAISVNGGNLAITNGAQLQMVFNAAGSAVNWADSFWASNHSWTIINFSGAGSSTGNFTIAGGPATWTDSLSQTLQSQRQYASFDVQNSANNLVVNYAVPEPSTYALAGIGGCIAGFMSLRRRRSAKRSA